MSTQFKTGQGKLSCQKLAVCLVFSMQYRLVTDGRTDGQMDRRVHDDGIYCASIASRGKKTLVVMVASIRSVVAKESKAGLGKT